jgi:hypothetical protein
MMGGGGGSDSRYPGPTDRAIEERIQQARAQEQQRLDFDVNNLLADILADFNGRDRALTTRRLDELTSILGDWVEVDKVLYGGSVAKHTEVDGISDVDALVILDRADLRGANAAQVREAFFNAISDGLPRGEAIAVSQGRLAVTVRYRDGLEVQLLPAVRQGNTIAVPSGSGGSWSITEPRSFQSKLVSANEQLRGSLVPAIKLMKAAVSKLPEQQRLKSYHLEALAVEAAKNYGGATTPRAVLLRLLESASQRVLTPIRDRTGQSKTVDAYLGSKSSLERRNVAIGLDSLRRRLAAATTAGEWKSILCD